MTTVAQQCVLVPTGDQPRHATAHQDVAVTSSNDRVDGVTAASATRADASRRTSPGRIATACTHNGLQIWWRLQCDICTACTRPLAPWFPRCRRCWVLHRRAPPAASTAVRRLSPPSAARRPPRAAGRRLLPPPAARRAPLAAVRCRRPSRAARRRLLPPLAARRAPLASRVCRPPPAARRSPPPAAAARRRADQLGYQLGGSRGRGRYRFRR